MTEQTAVLMSEFDERLRLIDEIDVPAPAIAEILARTEETNHAQSRDSLRLALAQVLDLPSAADVDSVAAALRNLLAVANDEILSATSSPTTEEFDRLLATLRKVSAAITSRRLDAEFSAFYSGQLNSLAEFCEVCRRQKVPFRTAEVLVRRREARAVLQQLHSAGSLTLTAIAKSLHKASQNLQATLKEMTATGLIRRDQIGQSALYSSTALGRLALGWSEKQTLAKPKAQSATRPTRKTASVKPQEGKTKEETLVKLAQSRDRVAFETLVRQYDQPVMRMALHLTGSPEEARDIYQETFLKAYRNLDKFRGDSSFYTWLSRIVANVCLDHLRQLRSSASQETEDTTYEEINEDPSNSSNSEPDRSLMKREIGAQLARALDRLTPRERAVFEMRHYRRLKLRSISTSLNTTEEAAKIMLVRATAKLRAALADVRPT